MQSNTQELNFTFFDVGGGDAIWIRFLGDDLIWHNILIDGGYGWAYKEAFGPLIRNITETANESVDLWVISHIDMDHIGSVLGFSQDRKIKDKKAAIKQFWFNHSTLPVSQGSGKLGVRQGKNLREFLEGLDLLVKEAITTRLPFQDFHGLKITVLSPNEEKARVADELWKSIEHKGKLGRSADKADHKEKLEALISERFTEDPDPWNGSSIALLLEFKGVRVLLSGDSHPSVVAGALTKLGFTKDKPLEAAFVQLSHHGSKANTSRDLLKLLNSRTFVVTGNGITNRHPDKETLARVLTQPSRIPGEITFIFPSDTDELRDLFAVDDDAYRRYNFRCVFPEAPKMPTTLNYLPFKKENHD